MAWPVPTPPPTPDPNPNLRPQHPCLQFVSLKLERDQAMAVKTDLEQQLEAKAQECGRLATALRRGQRDHEERAKERAVDEARMGAQRQVKRVPRAPLTHFLFRMPLLSPPPSLPPSISPPPHTFLTPPRHFTSRHAPLQELARAEAQFESQQHELARVRSELTRLRHFMQQGSAIAQKVDVGGTGASPERLGSASTSSTSASGPASSSGVGSTRRGVSGGVHAALRDDGNAHARPASREEAKRGDKHSDDGNSEVNVMGTPVRRVRVSARSLREVPSPVR